MNNESTVSFYMGRYNKFIYKVNNNEVKFYHNGTWYRTNSTTVEQLLDHHGWTPLTYEEVVLELL